MSRKDLVRLHDKYGPNKKVRFAMSNVTHTLDQPTFSSLQKQREKSRSPEQKELLKRGSNIRSISPPRNFSATNFSFRPQEEPIEFETLSRHNSPPIRLRSSLFNRTSSPKQRIEYKNDFQEHAKKTLQVASNIKKSQDTNYMKAMNQTYSTPLFQKPEPITTQFNPHLPLHQYENNTSFSTPLNSAGAKLKDLCPEDRMKIGELMKKLAEEKEEKERMRKALEEKDQTYQETIEKFKKQNHDILSDAFDIKANFQQSLNLLKAYKDVTGEGIVPKNQASVSFAETMVRSQKKRKGARASPPQRDGRREEVERGYHEFIRKPEPREEFESSRKGSQTPSRERSLIKIEPGKTEKELVEKRMSDKKMDSSITSFDYLQLREDRTLSEIQKLKEEVHELAQSVRKAKFSPEGHDQSSVVVPPIKLAENQETKEPKRHKKPKTKPKKKKYREESNPTSRSEERETTPENNRSISKSSIQKEEDYEEESTVIEQELEVAEKWLDHRKKKIAQVSKELKKDRESRVVKQRLPQEEPTSNYSSKVNLTKDTYDSRGSANTQPSTNTLSQKSFVGIRRDDSKNIRIEDGRSNYASNERLSEQFQTQSDVNKSKDYYKRDSVEHYQTTPNLRQISNSNSVNSLGPGILDIDKMTPQEMIELKRILEERIKLESVDHKINEIQLSAQKKIAKIEALLTINQANIKNMEQDLEEAAVNIAAKNFETELKQSRGHHLRASSKNYETQSKLVDRTAADSSLMRDFESINNTPYRSMLNSRQKVEARVRELEGLDDIEREYQEKLQDFLKIRDKMIMSKRYKEFKFNPEDHFKGSKSGKSLNNSRGLLEEGRPKLSKVNSPSLRSLTNNEILSEKDLEYSPNSQGLSFAEKTISTKKSLNGTRSNSKKINFAPDTDFQRKRKESDSYRDQSKSNVSAEFYDDNLIKLVDDLEKKESLFGNTSKKAEANSQSQSRFKASADEEFNSLFASVRTMNNEDESERIKEKLFKRFEKVDLIPAGYSSEEAEDTDRSGGFFVRDTSPSLISPLISGRNPRKTEQSSIIETDLSVLAINKKIEEMRREQNKATEADKFKIKKNVSH